MTLRVGQLLAMREYPSRLLDPPISFHARYQGMKSYMVQNSNVLLGFQKEPETYEKAMTIHKAYVPPIICNNLSDFMFGPRKSRRFH